MMITGSLIAMAVVLSLVPVGEGLKSRHRAIDIWVSLLLQILAACGWVSVGLRFA